MKNRVRLERIIVIAGILVVLFLTLVTSSYYQNVLKQVGEDGGEDGNEYRYHYVMIVEDSDMPFWKDVYESTREAAREHNALVELMGKSLSSTIEMESLMDMAIASGVDGIILEYTGGHKIDERINEADKAGIPVVTVLKDAPDTSRISFVGVNDYQLGRQYGEQIFKLVPPDKDDVEVMLLLHDRDNSSQEQIADQILEAVRKGNIPVTLVIDTEQMGRYCVQALEEYLQEGHANSYYSVDLQFVTKENVSQLMKHGR